MGGSAEAERYTSHKASPGQHDWTDEIPEKMNNILFGAVQILKRWLATRWYRVSRHPDHYWLY